MIHERRITLMGPDYWVRRTLANSLPEGVNACFGQDNSIVVETLLGDPVRHDMPKNKPEHRFDLGQFKFETLKEYIETTGRFKVIEKSKDTQIHLLIFDDGSGSGRIEKASFDGAKINGMVDSYNGEGGECGPYCAVSIDIE